MKSERSDSSANADAFIDQRLRFHLGAKSLKGEVKIPPDKHALGVAVLAFEGGSLTPRGMLWAVAVDRSSVPGGKETAEFMWTVDGKASRHSFTCGPGIRLSTQRVEDGWLESAGSVGSYASSYPRLKAPGDYEVLSRWISSDDVNGKDFVDAGPDLERTVSRARKSLLLVSKVLATEAETKAFLDSIHLMR